MRPLLAEDILKAWEAGQPQAPAERALTLLSRACPDSSQNELAELPLGQRDRLLLELRATSIGNELKGLSHCPSCSATVSVCLGVDELLARAGEAQQPGELETQGCRLQFRLPDSSDLLALGGFGTEEEARASLLSRCVFNAWRGDVPLAIEALPDDVLTELEEYIDECDPLAETLLGVCCPECGEQWFAELDVAAFLWQELRSLALSLLNEIDALARAYGWSEADVLALNPARRAWYLQRVCS